MLISGSMFKIQEKHFSVHIMQVHYIIQIIFILNHYFYFENCNNFSHLITDSQQNSI